MITLWARQRGERPIGIESQVIFGVFDDFKAPHQAFFVALGRIGEQGCLVLWHGALNQKERKGIRREKVDVLVVAKKECRCKFQFFKEAPPIIFKDEDGLDSGIMLGKGLVDRGDEHILRWVGIKENRSIDIVADFGILDHEGFGCRGAKVARSPKERVEEPKKKIIKHNGLE